MLVMSIIAQKGGAGKTTVARCLISAMVATGKRVVILDCDPNESAFLFYENMKVYDPASAEFVIGHHCKSPNELVEMLNQYDADGSYDFAIIDTEGQLAHWTEQVIALSDRVVIPVSLSRTDVLLSLKTLNFYQELRNRLDNPDEAPPCVLLLNSLENEKKYNSGLKETLQSILGHPDLLRKVLNKRNTYADADDGILIGSMVEKYEKNKLIQKVYSESLDECIEVMNAIIEVDI